MDILVIYCPLLLHTVLQWTTLYMILFCVWASPYVWEIFRRTAGLEHKKAFVILRLPACPPWELYQFTSHWHYLQMLVPSYPCYQNVKICIYISLTDEKLVFQYTVIPRRQQCVGQGVGRVFQNPSQIPESADVYILQLAPWNLWIRQVGPPYLQVPHPRILCFPFEVGWTHGYGGLTVVVVVFFFLIDFIFFFTVIIRCTAKYSRIQESSHIFPVPSHTQPPPLPAACTRVAHLL